MSGHSKWATTKRKKEAADQKRGKVFSKLSKVISVAAREGADPDMNPSLRVAVDNARAASMPKENIERAIQKGSGGGDDSSYEEIMYGAIGPAGSGILIECLTDNKNRAQTEVKTVLNKAGVSMVSAGSVLYQFKKEGKIIIDLNQNKKPVEEIEEIIYESGAKDYEIDGKEVVVTTNYQDLHNVQKMLSEADINIQSAELTYNSTNNLDLSSEEKNKVENLFESLEDLDDVNKIYSNINF